MKRPLQKVVDESFPVKAKRGGGIIKIEDWEDSKRNIVKYSMAYINHSIYPDDNGRVLGYDNTHGYLHRHYKGEIMPVDDFVSYHDLVERFEKEVKELIR